MLIIGCDFHTRHQQIAMAEDPMGVALLRLKYFLAARSAIFSFPDLVGEF